MSMGCASCAIECWKYMPWHCTLLHEVLCLLQMVDVCGSPGAYKYNKYHLLHESTVYSSCVLMCAGCSRSQQLHSVLPLCENLPE